MADEEARTPEGGDGDPTAEMPSSPQAVSSAEQDSTSGSDSDDAPEPPPKPGVDDDDDDIPSIRPPSHTGTPDIHDRPQAPPIQIEPPQDGEVASPPTTHPSQPSESPAATRHHRTDSQSTTATTDHRTSAKTSLVFVTAALESINNSKDASKRKELKESTQQALSAIKTIGDPSQIDPKILFAPLRLATQASDERVVTQALDCIGKLISYSYFSVPSELQDEAGPTDTLIDQAIDAICDCFEGEATSEKVQLQITISLLAAVLNDKVIVHGAGLLKAVRQMYNIFLHTKNTRNQQVAQGALTQMVGTVFERARLRVAAKEARANASRTSLETSHDGSEEKINGNGADTSASGEEVELTEPPSALEAPSEVPVEKEERGHITLKSFERRGSFDEQLQEGPTMVTRARSRGATLRRSNMSPGDGTPEDLTTEDEEEEVFLKDAFLVFRAMCKISIKSLRSDELIDLKSQGMRTKLLSLHIIHMVLFNNVSLFLSPYAIIRGHRDQEATTLTQAIKQLLCQSLSRNGASSVNRIYEIGCEIFWMMLKHLRVLFKKEIEVFLKEIYLSILDNRNAPAFQKQCFLNVLQRLAGDPRALVEIYLNYDCDRTASDNMFQRIVEHLGRMATQHVTLTSTQALSYREQAATKQALQDWQVKGTVPPSLSTIVVGSSTEIDPAYPMDYAMKLQALECVVEILRSLVHWAQQGLVPSGPASADMDGRVSSDDMRDSTSEARSALTSMSSTLAGIETPSTTTPLAEDDPMQVERAKQRKTALLNAVRQFNFKPKRGLKALVDSGFISSRDPNTIAEFLLKNDQLDKAAIGEFLGEGDEENVAIMHAFVDSMDFNRTRFVDALRRFLQSFRLPGEAQKIDRFMLKFAERYIQGNPNAFANADTAYVLAYSVILLNTDQHSTKMKGRRMTPEDFIKNNRGINDNSDLPEDYLRGIYDEIGQNEIVLDTEREAAANQSTQQAQPGGGFTSGIGQAFATVGRDLQREAYIQRAEEMQNKTEQLFKNLLRVQRRSNTRDDAVKFIPATSFKHVGPMFDVTWTPFLTALSGCAQDTNNMELVRLCMDGLKLAVQIACLFDLETPRMAFISALSRFTNLYKLSEMQAKNVEALRVLLDVAYTEGNSLKESWREILTTISQLDRFQLISEGVPEHTLPDVLRAQPTHTRSKSRSSLQVPPKRTNSGHSTSYRAEIAEEARGAGIVNGVDRIFTSTSRLNGDAIVDFVKALSQVSWQEIESSGQSEEPRTYSLQKLVEVSGYNMSRVRFEWTNIWQVMGDHFNQVGCHSNTKVVHFALNSLRQLSVRFLDLEELPGFKFQKDFLKPFEQIIGNATHVFVKEIVLHSLVQLIQTRGQNIRSGWRTIFGTFTIAARERFEGIVNLAYDNVIQVYNARLGIIMNQGALADLVVCLTEFSKNARFQKKSLQAIETLKGSIPKMLKTPECPLSPEPSVVATPKQPSRQTQEEQYWFPVLFAFHDVLMTGEDLEVRSRALNYLFDTLIKYGHQFPSEFWDIIWRQLLQPIFLVLKSKSEMTKMVNHEELSVWLSTTMIQALRNMISLFTHYFDALQHMLDRWLDLLAMCICQENDTLARIGSNCLQTLILSNVNKFTADHWNQVVNAFVDLFNRTEATALFSAAAAPATYGNLQSPTTNGALTPGPKDAPNVNELQLSEEPTSGRKPSEGQQSRSSINSRARQPSPMQRTPSDSTLNQGSPSPASTPTLEDYRPESTLQSAPIVVTAARRRFFNQIITKCVLQLLMIETVNELFSNDTVYARIPSAQLLRLMTLLKKSYHFAKRFNDDVALRERLFNEGFMRQPPNLLKQESGSASVYVNILFRMYHDTGEERRASREQTEAALIPLCADIISSFAQLNSETQHRNIVTWRPVVVDVIEGYAGFPEDGFKKHVASFAPLATMLMSRDMGLELQRATQALVHRILEQHYEMPPLQDWALGMGAGGPMSAAPTPVSPRASVFNRRNSKQTGVPTVEPSSAR